MSVVISLLEPLSNAVAENVDISRLKQVSHRLNTICVTGRVIILVGFKALTHDTTASLHVHGPKHGIMCMYMIYHAAVIVLASTTHTHHIYASCICFTFET